MPSMQLPANPNITHLKNQAKDLKRAVEAGDPEAVGRVREAHPGGDKVDVADFALRDAQTTLAREYGFESWHRLNTEVGERIIEERDLHRWFGVQLNNGIWDKIEDDTIGPDTPATERDLLLYSAYAAAYHWMNAGTEANHARGEHLISRMAARLGDGDVALRHARRCLEVIEANRGVMEDWDEPFAHEAMARAYAATGRMAAAQRHLDLAMKQTAAVADAGGREVLEGELARGPWFGLR